MFIRVRSGWADQILLNVAIVFLAAEAAGTKKKPPPDFSGSGSLCSQKGSFALLSLQHQSLLHFQII